MVQENRACLTEALACCGRLHGRDGFEMNGEKSWIRRSGALCAAALLLATMAAGLSGCGGEETADGSTQPMGAQTQVSERSGRQGRVNPLTGLDGLAQEAVGKRPVAVMINNAPAARPQWGLCSPDIVIEGLVEGGMTRMMWLFADVNSIPKIGSLRSARHDFLEVAEGFDAIFVHWGGSVYAYDALRQRNVDDIDGMVYSNSYFYRDKSRKVATEHTGCTDGERLAKAVDKIIKRPEAKQAYQTPFSFVEEGKQQALSGGACESVRFSFSSAYTHTFRYDASTGLYQNFMNDKPMTQDGGKQMAVSNVLLLYCPVKSMGDSSGCIDMDLTGGSGVYVSNGTQEKITWKKGNTPSNPIKLYAANGAELNLNPGKSYIGFVPAGRQENTVISAGTEA